MKSQAMCAAACTPNADHLSEARVTNSHPVSDQVTGCKRFLLNYYFLSVKQGYECGGSQKFIKFTTKKKCFIFKLKDNIFFGWIITATTWEA